MLGYRELYLKVTLQTHPAPSHHGVVFDSPWHWVLSSLGSECNFSHEGNPSTAAPLLTHYVGLNFDRPSLIAFLIAVRVWCIVTLTFFISVTWLWVRPDPFVLRRSLLWRSKLSSEATSDSATPSWSTFSACFSNSLSAAALAVGLEDKLRPLLGLKAILPSLFG